MSQLHETISEVASKATIAGSAGTFLSWLNSSEFGMWAGIVIGVAGLVVNLYFKRKSDRRNKEAHDVFLAALKAGVQVAPSTPTTLPSEAAE